MKQHVLAALISAAFASSANAQLTGPSSSASPYVTATAPGWSVTSLLTVGDSVNLKPNGTPYRMVGIADGLGAFDNGNNTFTVLMNHELGATAGIVRAHGSTGGFVSEWVINKSTLQVLSGRDLITDHQVWDNVANTYKSAIGLAWSAGTNQYIAGTTANSFARLCSADLPAVSAFFNAKTGLGTQTRIFMSGEETGAEGRAYASIVTGADKGKSFELNKMGKFSWENSLANPYSGDKTVVIGTDDSTPGQVMIYTGTKTAVGTDIERAGLTNGALRGVKVNVAAAQGGLNGNIEQGQINGAFSTVALNTNVSGANQQIAARTAGITEFARPEDGHWADENTFYFVTTGATPGNGVTVTQSSRLYKLSFAQGVNGVDFDNGSVSMVLDSVGLVGKDGATARTFDNMTVADDGTILLQEDPGGNAYIAKTWHYDPVSKKTTQILESDRNRYLAGAPGFQTIDEESSGVIEVTSVLGRADGKRHFLGVMQAHYGIAGELVEGGQLYMFSDVSAVPEPSSYALMFGGLGLVAWMARRRKTARGD